MNADKGTVYFIDGHTEEITYYRFDTSDPNKVTVKTESGVYMCQPEYLPDCYRSLPFNTIYKPVEWGFYKLEGTFEPHLSLYNDCGYRPIFERVYNIKSIEIRTEVSSDG